MTKKEPAGENVRKVEMKLFSEISESIQKNAAEISQRIKKLDKKMGY